MCNSKIDRLKAHRQAKVKCGTSGKLLVLYALAYCLLVHGNLYQDSHPWRILIYGIFAISVFFEYIRSPCNCGLTYYLCLGLMLYGIILGLINFHRPFFSWYSLLSDLIALSGFLIGTMLCATKGNIVIAKTLTICFHYLFLLAILATIWSLYTADKHQRLINMSIITAIDYSIRLFPIVLCYKRLSQCSTTPLLGSWLLILIIIALTGSRGSLLIYMICTLWAIISSINKTNLYLVIASVSAIGIFSSLYLADLDLF
ncbi:MAG: hypothetical protein LBI37_01320 [Puniceicoccales bacterium]|nr:hypothetical protein [Puniceicoccales bacterium]